MLLPKPEQLTHKLSSKGVNSDYELHSIDMDRACGRLWDGPFADTRWQPSNNKPSTHFCICSSDTHVELQSDVHLIFDKILTRAYLPTENRSAVIHEETKPPFGIHPPSRARISPRCTILTSYIFSATQEAGNQMRVDGNSDVGCERPQASWNVQGGVQHGLRCADAFTRLSETGPMKGADD